MDVEDVIKHHFECECDEGFTNRGKTDHRCFYLLILSL